MEIQRTTRNQITEDLNQSSILQISNPKLTLMNSEITTIADVLEQKGHPSIAKMSRTYSQPKMKLMIVKWLMEVNKLLNLKKPMSEDQIVLGASYIMEDYKNLNVADSPPSPSSSDHSPFLVTFINSLLAPLFLK